MSVELPPESTVASDMVNACIDEVTDSFLSRFLEDEFRHAELAALVSKLTVSVEALERKVEALVRLELEDAKVIPKADGHMRLEHEGATFVLRRPKGKG